MLVKKIGFSNQISIIHRVYMKASRQSRSKSPRMMATTWCTPFSTLTKRAGCGSRAVGLKAGSGGGLSWMITASTTLSTPRTRSPGVSFRWKTSRCERLKTAKNHTALNSMLQGQNLSKPARQIRREKLWKVIFITIFWSYYNCWPSKTFLEFKHLMNTLCFRQAYGLSYVCSNWGGEGWLD